MTYTVVTWFTSVYLSDLSCWTNYTRGTHMYLSENDEIRFSCHVEVAGGWQPDVTCQLAGRRLQVMNTSGSFVVSVTATRQLNNQSVICNVQFHDDTRPTVTLTAASNVPVYDVPWTSEPLHVTCTSTTTTTTTTTYKKKKITHRHRLRGGLFPV